jgi:hypothetical protein
MVALIIPSPIATYPADLNLGLDKFVRTDDGSEQMAINGESTHAEDVWDGTEAGDTGSDWSRGGEGSESTDAARSGTNGLDTGSLSQNDIWWFDYGSNRDMESLFDSISFWINAQSHPPGSVLRCGWASTGSTTIDGNSVKVSDYLSNNDLEVWYRVQIPLADFNLSGSVGRFIFQARQTDNQQYYIDDVDMLNSTDDGPYKFRITGVADERRLVSRITLTISADTTGWDSSSFADVSGGLELGLILRQGVISTQEVTWSIVLKNNIELFTAFSSSDVVNFDDLEQMVVFTIEPGLATIVLEEDDALEFIIRDDLSTLHNMRAAIQYGVEGA